MRCPGSASPGLVYYWCTSTGHWAGAGAGAEEVTQHSAVDTKATVTPHQTRLWSAIYHLFIANLYLSRYFSVLATLCTFDNAYLLKDYFGWDCYILSSLDSDLSLR